MTTAAPPSLSEDSFRALALVLVRESDEFRKVLFDGMRRGTYAKCPDTQPFQAIAQAGMEPAECSGNFTIRETLADGSPRLVTVVVEEMQVGKTRAKLFSYRGVYHLWSMASAKRTDEAGRNEFTDLFAQVLRRLRPKVVYASGFSRLVRDQKQGTRLLDALDGNVDVIHADLCEIHLTGPQRTIGLLLYQTFAMIASMERDWIAERLQAGKVAKWHRGQWPFGSSWIPFGYTLDLATGRLVPDESKRPAVEELLRLLALELPPKVLLQHAGDLGVTVARHFDRGDVPADRSSNPTSKVHSLYAMASIWICGEYLHRLSTSTIGATQIGGAPVVYDQMPPGTGEIQMLHRIDLPEGGWASPEVLTATRRVVARWHAERNTRYHVVVPPLAAPVAKASHAPELLAVTTSTNRPGSLGRPASVPVRTVRGRQSCAIFAGRTWRDDKYVYELRVASGATYAVYRQPRTDLATTGGEVR